MNSKQHYQFDKEKIKKGLINNAQFVIEHCTGLKLQSRGSDWRFGVKGEESPAFSYDPQKGTFVDYKGRFGGSGDLLILVADHYELSIQRQFKLILAKAEELAGLVSSHCSSPLDPSDFQSVQAPTNENREHNEQEENQRKIAWSKTTIASAPSAYGGLPDRYLRNRFIAMPPDNPDYRFRAMRHRESNGVSLPVMLLPFRKNETGEITGYHRTYLSEDGETKSDLKPAKMAYGSMRGCSIRLTPPDYKGDGTLVIGEGIETTLSAQSLYREAAFWACGSMGLMDQFNAPDWVKKLVIIADENSQSAKRGEGASSEQVAWNCKERHFQRQMDVELILPLNGDLNDHLKRLGGKVASLKAMIGSVNPGFFEREQLNRIELHSFCQSDVEKCVVGLRGAMRRFEAAIDQYESRGNMHQDSRKLFPGQNIFYPSPPKWHIRATAGTGKSYAAIDALNYLIPKHPDRPILFCCQTVEMLDDTKAKILKICGLKPDDVLVHRGKSKPDIDYSGIPDPDLAPPMCHQHKCASKLLKLNISASGLCKDAEGNPICPHFHECGSRKQQAEFERTQAKIILMAHNCLSNGLPPNMARKPWLIIIDEAFWQHFFPKAYAIQWWALSQILDQALREATNISFTEQDRACLEQLRQVMESMAHEGTERKWSERLAFLPLYLTRGKLPPDADWSGICAKALTALDQLFSNNSAKALDPTTDKLLTSIRQAQAFYEALLELVQSDQESTPNLRVWPACESKEGALTITINRMDRKDRKTGQPVVPDDIEILPMLYLDATPPPFEALPLSLRPSTSLSWHVAHNPRHVTHVKVHGAKMTIGVVQAKGTNPTAKNDNDKGLSSICKFALGLITYISIQISGTPKILVTGPNKIVRHVELQSKFHPSFADIEFRNFEGLVGLNDFENHDALINLGANLIPPSALHDEISFLLGRGLEQVPTKGKWDNFFSHDDPPKRYGYRDPLADQWVKYRQTALVEQAIARVRPIRRKEGDGRCLIYDVSDVVTNAVPDFILHPREL